MSCHAVSMSVKLKEGIDLIRPELMRYDQTKYFQCFDRKYPEPERGGGGELERGRTERRSSRERFPIEEGRVESLFESIYH